MIKYVLFFLLATCAYADEWTTADITRESAYQTLAVVDWLQTRNIAHNPNYWEQNVILGNHPSVAKVNQYFVITGIGHYLVSDMFSGKSRAVFQYITIGIEVCAVGHNFSIGLNATF